MKRLVACCDGTWNTPDQMTDGKPCPTNVAKLASAVAPVSEAGLVQKCYYQEGVGTRPWERLRGGAFGWGLSRDVQSVYRFVVENFEVGDELFFFGYSRGAFTVRSTVGLIRNVGILRREHADRVEEGYALYRDRSAGPDDAAAAAFRRSYSVTTPVRFIGVWDTVGALGIPWSGVPLVNRINRRFSFHDTRLSSTVEGAFQALAIDEKRKPFEPAVWRSSPAASGQRVEQVWFPGVHGDVGGGYADASLADVALMWMVQKAGDFGLAFEEDAFTPAGGWGAPGSPLPAVDPDPFGPLHESRRWFFRLFPPYTRPIGVTDSAHEYAASTAVERRDRDQGYHSPGLRDYLEGAHQLMPVG